MSLKRLISWCASMSLFWLGHVISIPMYRMDCFAWLYPAYNNLMHWSLLVSEWGGAGLWSERKDGHE